MSTSHIFPLFLGADVVTLTATSPAIPITTSFVVLDNASTVTATLAAGTIPGQMMTVLSKGVGVKNIAVSSPLSTDADLIQLASAGQTVLLMWTGSKWAVLMAEAAGTVD